jgi:hypothetical protein
MYFLFRFFRVFLRSSSFVFLGLPLLANAGAPSVIDITEISNPNAGGGIYYDEGETISFQVDFSEDILVSGTPKLKFESQNLQNEAIYITGSGSSSVQFDFVVPAGKNDWNGITANRFEINTSFGEDIESVSTNEDIVEDFDDIELSDIKIDSSDPDFDRIEITTTDGQLVNGITYLKSGDRITSKIFLTQNDTRSAASVDFQIGASTKTLTFTGTNTNGTSDSSQKTTASDFLDGENGAITITRVSWTDQAGKNFTESLSQSTTFLVDTTVPSFTSIDLSGVVDDGYIGDLEKSDADPVVNNLQGSGYDQARYALIESGSTCDNSVDFNVLGAAVPVATDFSEDKTYQVCVELTDNAGNPTAYGTSSNIIRDTVYPDITNIPLANEAADQYVSVADKTADNPLALLNASGFDIDDFSIVSQGSDCDSSVSYDFADIPTANQISGGDGYYEICTRLSDLAGNIVYGKSASFFVQDTTFPVFQGVTVSSDNIFHNNYARSDSNLTFTLKLQDPETFIGPGAATGKIDFTIGSSSIISVNLNESASDSLSDTYTASYAVNGENGVITVEDIIFQDKAGQDITGFATQAPTPIITVDSTAPQLSSVSRETTNSDTAWAKAGDRITHTLYYSEPVAQSTTTTSTTITGDVITGHGAQNASTLIQEADLSAYDTTDQIIFEVVSGDNGNIVLQDGGYEIVDQAGNTTTVNYTDINALVSGAIQADTTPPEINQSTIFSDNSLDTSLARSNDTITVSFLPEDNLSPTIALENASAHILNNPLTNHNINITGSGSVVERFTDGSEQSETVVPFNFRIQDEAGNFSSFEENTTDDGSTVRFDRTNPLTRQVTISATSQDNSAYQGDVPVYYAKKGDFITLALQTCDYVDVGNPAPRGNLFGQDVTLTDAGLTAESCTTPQGNSGFWRNWNTTMNDIDGTEGVITFDILVKDNAGNGNGGNLQNGNPDNAEVHVTGTTDGTRVIFDKTMPKLPQFTITALDKRGIETQRFKHRLNAEFNWSGAEDNDINTTDVSGIYQYDVRLTNPSNGMEEHKSATLDFITIWDATISDHSDFNGERIPPRDPKYNLHMSIIDKAGNRTPEEIIYQQYYTIGLEGTVTDQDGYVLPGVIVNAVSRFGDECDTGYEVCSDITDRQGRYNIVLKKDRTYNVSFFDTHHYLEKSEIYIPFEDVTHNASLDQIEDERAYQTGDQTIYMLTDKIAFSETNTQTYIEVKSYSGEITTTEEDGKIIITSLSRITNITSNDPEVSITETSPNVYTVENAGSISLTSAKSDLDQKSTFGDPKYKIASEFSSGTSRLGVKQTAGNGKARFRFPGQKRGEHLIHGKFWTEAQSKAFTEKFNQGYLGHVKTYKNHNGYEVFAGYQNGRLALERYPHRYQNEIRYRGIKNSKIARLSSDKNLLAMHELSSELSHDNFGNFPKNISQKMSVMKQKYQKNSVNNAKSPEPIKIGHRKTNAEKAAHTIKSRKLFWENNTKSSEIFARKRIQNVIPSRITKNDHSRVQLRFNGQGIPMDTFFPLKKTTP